ncbi:photosynthetic NDH subunit of subcomplex B 3, chloroplastic-like [Zingiber officinale]|uniref:photosynthetic NDH subunit of subcomplex B 3, chloroplastic-like n=1 Tax=Zingiber officinale TaxID=94328 RepID=UPI001C4CCD58|nr:photosynthetic NDH subunit of subcomplex B 3, chloroplastic-like [Zingiber officinale]
MGLLQLNPPAVSSIPTIARRFPHTPSSLKLLRHCRLFAIATNPASSDGSAAPDNDEPPSIDFAFVHPRLMPDGLPDVHCRSACGGQKLRDIMLDHNIDLYGPYDGPLLNCSGGGICGTCLVEVVDGKELLSLRTDKEKKLLKKKPKTWRLACQTVVGNKDTRGELVIQQLPDWKVHNWEDLRASEELEFE